MIEAILSLRLAYQKANTTICLTLGEYSKALFYLITKFFLPVQVERKSTSTRIRVM